MPTTVRQTKSDQVFDQNTPEVEIARFVDNVKQSPEYRNSLLSLLPERIPLYVNRSTNETIRIRGYTLAAFEQTGLPEAALPYVLEELESGRDAYLVAAAAKAVRGLEKPTNQLIPFLLKAVRNIKGADDSVSFQSYRPVWPVISHTTALEEIFKTFGWLGAHGQGALGDLEALAEDRYEDFSAKIKTEIQNAIARIRSDERNVETGCCAIRMNFRVQVAPEVLVPPSDIEFEDQDGNLLRYQDFFSGTPSIVVFFYSRCNNPNKCSLTITKLARLQQAIQEAGLDRQLKTAAITYDPSYDLPLRLRAYGLNRGVLFSRNNRILRTRTPAGFKAVQSYFELGVNFIGSIVNRHRLELFILNDKGEVVATFARLQWGVQEVLDQAKALLSADSSLRWSHQPFQSRPILSQFLSIGFLSTLVPLVVAFFPKCPLCWAAYLSALGIAGLEGVPYSPGLLPVFTSLMIVNLVLVYKRGRQCNRMSGFYLSFLGTFVVLVLSSFLEIPHASYFGILMIFAGSLLSSLPSGPRPGFGSIFQIHS